MCPQILGGETMARFERNTAATAEPDDRQPRRFELKEKVKEMMKYGMPMLDAFPRRNRALADTMREKVLQVHSLVIRLELKYSKKTTLEELDIALADLKDLVEIASDKDYCGPKYAPPLTMRQREVWSRHNAEIGRMIGGYKKALESKRADGNGP